MTEEQRIYQRAYRKANKERIRKVRKRYRDANYKKIKAQKKAWRDANPEKCKAMNSKRNQKQINAWQNKKYRDNPVFRVRRNITNAINLVLKRNGHYKKITKTKEIIGCSFEFLKEHLQSQFEPWMNWDNHGLYNGAPGHGWDIDHIVPVGTAKTEKEIIKLNHYTNLRPLCSYINRVVKRCSVHAA